MLPLAFLALNEQLFVMISGALMLVFLCNAAGNVWSMCVLVCVQLWPLEILSTLMCSL